MFKINSVYYQATGRRGVYLDVYNELPAIGSAWKGGQNKVVSCDLVTVIGDDGYDKAIYDVFYAVDGIIPLSSERIAVPYVDDEMNGKEKAYMEAFIEMITKLVPDFDVEADKQSGSPWCIHDFDPNSKDQAEAAKENAKKFATEIAESVADCLESEDSLPRIILIDSDEARQIYHLENLYDIYARGTIKFDFDAIQQAFFQTPKVSTELEFEHLIELYEEA